MVPSERQLCIISLIYIMYLLLSFSIKDCMLIACRTLTDIWTHVGLSGAFTWHLNHARFYIHTQVVVSSQFFFLFVCRVTHSKVLLLQSKLGRNSHSSNRYACVVFTHRRVRERGREKPCQLFQQYLGFPPSSHTTPRPSYLPHRGIPPGLTQSHLMEVEVERRSTGLTKSKDHNLSFKYLWMVTSRVWLLVFNNQCFVCSKGQAYMLMVSNGNWHQQVAIDCDIPLECNWFDLIVVDSKILSHFRTVSTQPLN